MKKKILISLLTIIIFTSCNKPKQLKVTLVFDQPIENDKYPSYVQGIVEPFFVNDCETAEEVLLKPINVVRADIKKSGKEINAWYFESMGELSVDFSPDWLKYYFTDSLVGPYLLQKTKNRKLKLNNYLKEGKNSFIFHDNSENEEYKGYPIYADGESLNKAIQAIACERITEVFVLINPSELKSTIATIEKPDKKTASKHDPCTQQTVADALDLKQAISEILNTNETLSNRIAKADEIWKTYCHPNAYVGLYDDADDEAIDVWDPGTGKNYFTNRLAILESIVSVSIFRVEFANNGKISGIHIIECQNASELI